MPSSSTGGGTAGTGGDGGSGGQVTSCDAICSGPCVFYGIDPDSLACADDCSTATDPDGQLDADECADEMAAWIDCADTAGTCDDPIEAPLPPCATEFFDWDVCHDVE